METRGENLTYQWQFSKDSGQTWTDSSQTGCHTDTISIAVTAARVGYLYRCEITDADGNVVYSEPGEIQAGQVKWRFAYDANGMRTQRTNGTTTYKYVYNGSSLTYMSVGSIAMYFSYGADGSPTSVTYGTSRYFYVKNLQGDVTAILNSSGAAVVEYTYDAWGNILSITGSMADTLGVHNPLRYRGYVYDNDTELYYLQSRYYDPQVGRFLIHDIVFDYDAGLQGFDLFAYCGNNPVNRIDFSGANSVEIKEEEKTGLLDKTEHEGCLPTGGDESNCERVGGGHGNPVHRERIDSFMDELAESGDYQTVYGNRALSTAGLEGSQRPDVIAVRNDGSYEIWEFASPSQACGTIGYSVLEAKIETMQAANPNARFHRIVPW